MTPAARLVWVRMYERTGDAGLTCRRCGVSRPTLRKWWRRYRAAGVHLHAHPVHLERELAGQVQVSGQVRHPRLAFSAVVIRSVPLSFQVARGASAPVSRGTSTVMSTNS